MSFCTSLHIALALSFAFYIGILFSKIQNRIFNHVLITAQYMLFGIISHYSKQQCDRHRMIFVISSKHTGIKSVSFALLIKF